jgi:hypothetical protein
LTAEYGDGMGTTTNFFGGSLRRLAVGIPTFQPPEDRIIAKRLEIRLRRAL